MPKMEECSLKTQKNRRRKRGPLKFDDFRALPFSSGRDKLDQALQLIFQVEAGAWQACMSIIREEKKLYAAWKDDPENEKKTYRCSTLYREWSKSKGPGKGWRHMAAPCPELKFVQRRILDHFLNEIHVHFSRHGFRRGSGIVSNAEHHLGMRHMFNVDIVNAYPTTFRSRIKTVLKNPLMRKIAELRGMKFDEEEKTLLLEALCDLVCLKDRLPQGPPSSPVILNICCYQLDKQLFELAMENANVGFVEMRLSVYADDITVSSNQPIPEKIRERVLEIIRENGYIPHTRKDKCHYYSPETGELPVVTGILLTPDGRMKLHPRKIAQYRAAFHQLSLKEDLSDEEVNRASGYLAAIRQVHPEKIPSKLIRPVAIIEAKIAAHRARRKSKPLPILTQEEQDELAALEAPPQPKTDANGVPKRQKKHQSKRMHERVVSTTVTMPT